MLLVSALIDTLLNAGRVHVDIARQDVAAATLVRTVRPVADQGRLVTRRTAGDRAAIGLPVIVAIAT